MSCIRAEGENAGMLAKRTSPSLAPSPNDLTRAQNLAQRGSGTRFSRRA
jgi:hypothetical protein